MTTSEEMEEKQGINWIQVAAGALAAVSSAVLLSTLGVAGTIIGAALGSVFASVGSAFYSRTLDVSRQQVAAQAAALRRVTTARSQIDEASAALDRGGAGAETPLHRADRALDEAEQALHEASDPGGGTAEPGDERASEPESALETAKRLPWKRIALIAGAVFVVAMIAITSFELVTGRAVSAYTGGSDRDTGATVPGIRDGGGREETPDKPERPQEEPEPSDEPTSEEPSESPSVETPEEPGPSDAPTEEEPTAEPSEEPSPTEGTTPAPDPGESAEVPAP